MICLSGAQVYDPAHGFHGEVRDVWIDDERIAAPPEDGADLDIHTNINLSGRILAPAGVEIHSHVAGYGLNSARRLSRGRPEVLRLLLPSAREAAKEYLRLGYTTVFDAASSPMFARNTHADLNQMDGIDRGCFTLMGDHLLLLSTLETGDRAAIRDVLAWLLRASGGYAVKLVNPGAGLAWKEGRAAPGLDDPLGMGKLTQREVIRRVAEAVNEMGLPHPVHLHAGRLGQPGNYRHFCETVGALEGQRAHLCHIQFYCYGDDGHGGFTSAADEVAHCLEQRPELTCDVGQVVFGSAMAITADTSAIDYLQSLVKHPWIRRQVEGEGGNNCMPLDYFDRDPSSAVQWATGLELLLTFPDPTRMFLTTDHPNGGPFLAYPQIIEWLMSRPARQEVLARIHPAGREMTGLGAIEREYSLSDIISMTSWGPARALGLTDRGHLGAGAQADLRCLQPQADIQNMFAHPVWVMRRCRLVDERDDTDGALPGETLVTRPEWDANRRLEIYRELSEMVTVQPDRYALGEGWEKAGALEAPC